MLSVLPSEFHKTCRLCLLMNEHVNVDIFEHKDIHYKMIACLPITISSDDKLPPKICFECRNKVNAFYDFWYQAKVSEKRLLSCSRTESQAINLDIIRNEDTTSVQNSRLDESESKKATVQVDYCEKVGYASLSEVNSGFEQLQGLGEELIYLYVEPEETGQNVNQLGSSTDKFHDPNSSNQFNFVVDMCTDDVSADDPQISSYSVEFPKCGRSIYRSKSSKKRKLAQSSNKEQLESYMCSICDISFSDKVEYHRHEVTHYVDYPYECALCGEHFKRSKQLDNHKSFRHMENWFSSSDTEMVDDNNLVNDVIIADEKNTLDCSNETLSSERMCCEICAKVFESQTSCEIHMKKHDVEDVIVCELCGRQFSASKNHRCTKIHFSG